MTYPGGKGSCYQHLINLMPPHRWYVESHLGSGVVMRRKRPAQKNIGIESDERVISRFESALPRSCEVLCGDALAVLPELPLQASDLVYMDPPYLPSTRLVRKVYRHEYDQADHERLLVLAQSLKCMVMISGYRSDLYDEALRGWSRREFSANSQSGARTECVWFNFAPPITLHDARYLGNDFRERQDTRRRMSRITHRLSKLSLNERAEVLKWLESSLSQNASAHDTEAI